MDIDTVQLESFSDDKTLREGDFVCFVCMYVLIF